MGIDSDLRGEHVLLTLLSLSNLEVNLENVKISYRGLWVLEV
jgi:hypothetical protein